MSDDEDIYEEDDYFEYEDFPFNEAEDLAAHTLPSPVWINFDPAWETASFASDWEYYSDEYWEQESSRKRKRKEDGDEATEAAKHDGENSKKRRETKLTENPRPHPSQPSVAASSIVWKSNKDTLESHAGPTVAEGCMEKVSVLKDWRQRFKPSTLYKLNESHLNSSLDGDKMLEDESFFKAYDDDALSPPPLTLKEPEGLPTRSTHVTEPPQGSLPEDYSAASFPSYDECFSLEDDFSQRMPVPEVDGITEVDTQSLSADDVEAPQPRTQTRGRLQRQSSANTCTELRGAHLQRPSQVVRQSRKKRPGRPKRQESIGAMDDKSSDEKGTPVKSTSYIRKRKAEDEFPASDSTGPKERTKRGRPKKQKPSALSKEIAEHDLEGSAENKPAPHCIANGISIAGTTRKEQSSEDDLSKTPKRQNSSEQKRRTAANDNATQSTMRRGRRRKRT